MVVVAELVSNVMAVKASFSMAIMSQLSCHYSHCVVTIVGYCNCHAVVVVTSQ
jgi:hypothetical protein